MKMIFQINFYRDDVFPLFKLTLPLVFSGLIEASINFFSTLFLAKLGHEELAAGALVSWLFVTLMVILWGTLTAISALIAQKHGAKEDKDISLILRDGFLLAFIFVIPTFIMMWKLSPFLLWIGQSPVIVQLAESYLHGLAWGLLPDLIMLVLLQFLIGLGHTRISMLFTFMWVPITIFLNYVLMFGKFGAPRLGIAGIGWGITLSYWITTTCLFLYLISHSTYRHYFHETFQWKKPFYISDILKIGAPMGAMYCVEVGFFLALSVLMGIVGSTSLAANQITLQFLAQIMALIFSIAQAVTVRMGHQLGANLYQNAERTSYAGITIALIVISIASFIYWVFPEKLIAIDLDIHHAKNAEVVQYATQFFSIVAFFQILEAVRITLFGSLRALKDTYFTLFTSIVSFWIIALPIGFLLTKTSLKGAGLWWGLVIGACCSVVLLSFRFNSKIKTIHRLHSKKSKV